MIYVTRYNGFAFTNVYRYLRYYYHDIYTVLYKIINIYIYIYIFGNKCSGSWISHATCSCSFLFKSDHLFILLIIAIIIVLI